MIECCEGLHEVGIKKETQPTYTLHITAKSSEDILLLAVDHIAA